MRFHCMTQSWRLACTERTQIDTSHIFQRNKKQPQGCSIIILKILICAVIMCGRHWKIEVMRAISIVSNNQRVTFDDKNVNIVKMRAPSCVEKYFQKVWSLLRIWSLTFWGCCVKWQKLNCRGEMDFESTLTECSLPMQWSFCDRFGTEGHDYWLIVCVYTASYSRKSYSSCKINTDYFAKQ